MDTKLKCIKQLDFFSSLNEEQLKNIHSFSKIVNKKENNMLYYEDDKFDKIFFLIHGLIKVYKVDKFDNEIFLYYIYNNSMISELTSIDANSIQCFSNAEFIEDSTILEINFIQFKKYFIHTNILQMQFMHEILNKTNKLHYVINREIVFDATSKVAFMIHNDLKMFNKLKRKEVSFMLHIQPETLSRVLNKLVKSEIININNLVIEVLNKHMLKQIYQRFH